MVLADNVPDGIDKLIEMRKQNPSAPPQQPQPDDGGRTAERPADRDAVALHLAERGAPGGADLDAAAAKVEAAIAEVREAQTSGDFARYGRALEALDKAMTEFQEAQRAAPAQPASDGGPRLTRRCGCGRRCPAAPAPDPVVLRKRDDLR